MDEEIEKELERIRNLSFDEMVAEGLIIPAENPDWQPTMKPIEILFAIILFGGLISCKNNIIKVPDSPYHISNDSFSLDTIAEGFTIP